MNDSKVVTVENYTWNAQGPFVGSLCTSRETRTGQPCTELARFSVVAFNNKGKEPRGLCGRHMLKGILQVLEYDNAAVVVQEIPLRHYQRKSREVR